MVKRPLGVTTHTALGTPVSVSSTCSWPASGIGNEHRAQVQARQLGDRRVVEIVDVERAIEFFALVGSLVGRGHDVVHRVDVLAGRADGCFFAVVFA